MKTRSSPILVMRGSSVKRPEWSSRPACTISATQSTRPEPQIPTGFVSPITCSSSSPSRDLHALDRALGGAHAAADLGRLEGRAGGRRGGQHALVGAERDLAVGADVDEQPHALVAREAGGQHAGHDVAADVGAERREDDGRRARVDGDAEVARQRRRQVVRGDDERRHRERLGVDAERELGHRHVADDDDLVDVVRRDARLLAHLAGELRERLVRARLERAERVLVEHRRRHARDDVGAVGLLAVEHRAHRRRRAGLEVEQRGDHRRGAEVEGDREPPRRRVARLDADQQVVDHHGGDVEVRLAQHLAERLAPPRAPRAARGRRARPARAARPTAGPRATAPRARDGASSPPAAGSRGGRRRPAPPSAASAAAARRSPGRRAPPRGRPAASPRAARRC